MRHGRLKHFSIGVMGREARLMAEHAKRERVLIVEDDPALRETLAVLLREHWDVVTAENVAEAWERIEEHGPPNIILSDMTMPGGSGLDLLQRVRSDERTRLVPFILVSAVSETDTVVQGLEMGANDYVSKPINPAILQARMATHLRGAEMQRRLERQNALLAHLAAFDDLTGVYNRRSMTTALEAEVTRCVRYHHAMAVLLLDLDHFKKVNDTHGHAAGDDVLRGFVQRITPVLRTTDILCRYGGEEFCVIMPETGQASATRAAERIRHVVEEQPFHSGETAIPLTVSIGLACLPRGFSDSPERLVEHADEALYQAKNAGRNRLVIYDQGNCQVMD